MVMDRAPRMVGTVYRWIVERGYGWIITSSGESYFLHVYDVRGLASKLDAPRVGDLVEFAATNEGRGLRALDARIVERTDRERKSIEVLSLHRDRAATGGAA